MKIIATVVIFVILLEQYSLANRVPQDIRRRADIADKRAHADEDISIESLGTLKQQLKRDGENENDFWLNIAKSFVDAQLTKRVNTNRAKNVIFFLADGMSVTTYSAARVAKGGEEESLSFESFPYVGMARTW